MKSSNAQKLKDARDELEQVNSAISAILSGAQGYRIGSRSIQKADLATLYKRKDSIEDLISSLEGSGTGFGRIIPVG